MLMEAAAAMNQARAARRHPPPADFRMYLLDGEHWRAGRRLRHGAAIFTGLAMHPTRDPHAYTVAWENHLEQVLTDDRVERDQARARVRHARVEEALRAVEEDRPEEVAALRFYLVPRGRRPRSVVAEADRQGLSVDALRDAAVRAVALVWEELGSAW